MAEALAHMLGVFFGLVFAGLTVMSIYVYLDKRRAKQRWIPDLPPDEAIPPVATHGIEPEEEDRWR